MGRNGLIILSIIFILTSLLGGRIIATPSDRGLMESRYLFIESEVGPDQLEIEELLQMLEGIRRKVGVDLNYYPEDKITIKIYKSTKSFMSYTDKPWWLAAIYTEGKIHIQPLAILKKRGILKTTLTHEFTHLVIDRSVGIANCPQWLNEGIAQYEAGEWNRKRTEDIKISLLNNPVLSIPEVERELNNRQDKDKAYIAYLMTYTIVEYLVDNFGPINTLLTYLKEGRDIKESIEEGLGISYSGFERGWTQYLVGKYSRR